MNPFTGVLGISGGEEALVSALEQLRRQGYRNVETFSPVPSDKLLEMRDAPKSPVRFYTLIGGSLGFVAGLSLTLGTALEWPLITGGKPIASIPPFLVIAFELTILLGGLFTIAGLGIHAGLLGLVQKAGRPELGYDARLGVDRFGVFIPCSAEQVPEVKQLLLDAGVEEISIEGA